MRSKERAHGIPECGRRVVYGPDLGCNQLVIERRLRDGNSGGWQKVWQMGWQSVRSAVCQMFMQMRPYEAAYNTANTRSKQRESFRETAYRWDQSIIGLKRFHSRKGKKGVKSNINPLRIKILPLHCRCLCTCWKLKAVELHRVHVTYRNT